MKNRHIKDIKVSEIDSKIDKKIIQKDKIDAFSLIIKYIHEGFFIES